MPTKVDAVKDAPRIAHQYALFLDTGQNREATIKEDWCSYAIGQDSQVVPGCILSLQRKMMATSSGNSENDETGSYGLAKS